MRLYNEVPLPREGKKKRKKIMIHRYMYIHPYRIITVTILFYIIKKRKTKARHILLVSGFVINRQRSDACLQYLPILNLCFPEEDEPWKLRSSTRTCKWRLHTTAVWKSLVMGRLFLAQCLQYLLQEVFIRNVITHQVIVSGTMVFARWWFVFLYINVWWIIRFCDSNDFEANCFSYNDYPRKY